jgi:hypothetical protein
MMLGLYNNFPQSIHMTEKYNSSFSSKQLQQRLILFFYEINRKKFNFEEITNPTIPDGTVIFEVGLAESDKFTFINKEEASRAIAVLSKERFQTIDFFCAIRYYKGKLEEKKPLKFDYYLMRTIFGKDTFEIQIFHERGPRYISPEDLKNFVVNKINAASTKKILKLN